MFTIISILCFFLSGSKCDLIRLVNNIFSFKSFIVGLVFCNLKSSFSCFISNDGLLIENILVNVSHISFIRVIVVTPVRLKM